MPKLISYCFSEFLVSARQSGKLNFQKSTTCTFWPQKFSFKLPIALKKDFERIDNARQRGVRLFTEIEVLVEILGFEICHFFIKRKR